MVREGWWINRKSQNGRDSWVGGDTVQIPPPPPPPVEIKKPEATPQARVKARQIGKQKGSAGHTQCQKQDTREPLQAKALYFLFCVRSLTDEKATSHAAQQRRALTLFNI